MKVIDCATDSIVASLPIPARNAILSLDTIHNKLYVGATDTFRVIDCRHDSVVASLYELRNAQAVCFAPSSFENKVYVGVDETLFAIRVKTDTVIYRHQFYSTANPIVYDAEHDRVYVGASGSLTAMNCADDSIVWSTYTGGVIGLAYAPAENKVYALTGDAIYAVDGETGRQLQWLTVHSYSGLQYSALLDRVFLVSNGGDEDNARAIDCRADTVVSITPLGAYVGYLEPSVCVDSADNKLYFSAGAAGVGVVDCTTNKVTSYILASHLPYPAGPPSIVYDAHGDKLYARRESSLFGLFALLCG